MSTYSKVKDAFFGLFRKSNKTQPLSFSGPSSALAYKIYHNPSVTSSPTFNIILEYNQKSLDCNTEYGTDQMIQFYKNKTTNKLTHLKMLIYKLVNKHRYRNLKIRLSEYQNCLNRAISKREVFRRHSYVIDNNSFDNSPLESSCYRVRVEKPKKKVQKQNSEIKVS